MEEKHLYRNIKLVNDSAIRKNTGFDLVEFSGKEDLPKGTATDIFKISKDTTILELRKSAAEYVSLPIEQTKLWIMNMRKNRTSRPDAVLDSSMDSSSIL
jgi:hypothetical protein